MQPPRLSGCTTDWRPYLAVRSGAGARSRSSGQRSAVCIHSDAVTLPHSGGWSLSVVPVAVYDFNADLTVIAADRCGDWGRHRVERALRCVGVHEVLGLDPRAGDCSQVAAAAAGCLWMRSTDMPKPEAHPARVMPGPALWGGGSYRRLRGWTSPDLRRLGCTRRDRAPSPIREQERVRPPSPDQADRCDGCRPWCRPSGRHRGPVASGRAAGAAAATERPVTRVPSCADPEGDHVRMCRAAISQPGVPRWPSHEEALPAIRARGPRGAP